MFESYYASNTRSYKCELKSVTEHTNVKHKLTKTIVWMDRLNGRNRENL